MLITRQNLAICSHCAKKPDEKGRAINNLQITGNSTIVTNGYYSIAISALESSDFGSPVLISPENASALLLGLGDREGRLERGISEVRLTAGKTTHRADIAEGKFPILEGFKAEEPSSFEFVFEVHYLLALAQSLADFDGDIARIQFFGPMEPIRIESRNIATGQKWEALLMGRRPGADKARFKDDPPPPAEPQDEFSRAMAEAAKLMGQ